jgi:hypothetical protein
MHTAELPPGLRLTPAGGEALPRKRPPLSEEQILAWADAHFARTGRRPTRDCGSGPEAPGETWEGVNHALRKGYRGLPGGDTLARLLDRHGRGGLPRPPHGRGWTAGEDGLVRALPPAEAARRIGRSVLAVHVRRHELGLPDQFPG